MLDWSLGAIKATVGIGCLGFLIYISDLDHHLLHVGMDYPPIFVAAFLPMIIFILAAPDMLPARIIRPAQWVAIAWYFLLVGLSVCVAVYRGLMAIDAFFAVFILIGAWPCLLAARKLRAAATRTSG